MDNYPMVFALDTAIDALARWTWTYVDNGQQYGTLRLAAGPPDALLGICRGCHWAGTYPNVDAIMNGADSSSADVRFTLVNVP